MTTIADSLAPEVLEQLGSTFRLELQELEASTTLESGWEMDEWIEAQMGFTTGEYLWDRAWRFGIVLDDDCEQGLGQMWQPDGVWETGYYVPSDHLSEVELIVLDGPFRAEEMQA